MSTVLLAARTDVGNVRSENEDSYGVWDHKGGNWDALLVIADGMGGHDAGKAASRYAVTVCYDELARASSRWRHRDDALVEADMREAVLQVHAGLGSTSNNGRSSHFG